MKSIKPTVSKHLQSQPPRTGDLIEFKLGNQTYVERVLGVYVVLDQNNNPLGVSIHITRPHGDLMINLDEVIKIHPRKSAAQEISRLREMANNLQDMYDELPNKTDILACCEEIITQANAIKDRVF